MRMFHVSIHHRPDDVVANGTIALAGETFATLKVAADRRDLAFASSFERAAAALGALPRLFIEPDGSFVWVSSAAATADWQLDGVLYDRDGKLLFVDLKGCSTAADFDQLLAALGSPPERVMFQLAREAVFIDELEFRRFAFGQGV